jgi:hypothetical protein
MFTYEEKLDELKRELDRREMLYPAHMRANLLSGHESQRRIDLLKEIITDYQGRRASSLCNDRAP